MPAGRSCSFNFGNATNALNSFAEEGTLPKLK
jgi:hypothetical protein